MPKKTTVTTVTVTIGLFTIHLKSNKSMRYDITKNVAPAIPTLGKGTECIKILLSQASKDMHEPPGSDVFPYPWRTCQRRRISIS